MNIFQKIKFLEQANSIYEQIQKGQPMTKWLPTLVTFILGIVGLSDSAIQTFVAAHPSSAIIFAAIYAIAKGLAASPLGKNIANAQKAAMVAMVLFLGLSVAPAHAQDLPSNLFAAGASYNSAGSPVVAGTGLYAHLAADNGTYAFTIADAVPTSTKPFTVTTNLGAGIAQKIFTIAKFPIFVPTSAGVSVSGTNTGWAWSTGVMTAIRFKQNYYIIPMVRVAKSSVSNGAGYQPIFGVLFGWGQ